jgi:hypothetical protein
MDEFEWTYGLTFILASRELALSLMMKIHSGLLILAAEMENGDLVVLKVLDRIGE